MNFLKTVLVGFLISHTALAGLPPTTAKGQGGSSSVSFETQAPFSQITKTDSVKALVETGNTNIIANPGFEAVSEATGWTASGGTYALTTTAANVGSGVNAASWDSSAAAQTLTSTAVAIPAGDYGANYEVSANLKCDSGTCTHLLQAYDGSNIVASQAITSSLTYVRTTVNFVAPSSGNLSSRLMSVASNEPTIYKDDVYIGRARNIGSVAQATLVGTLKVTGCSSNWSGTTGSYSNFATQTSCSYSVTGSVEAPTTNVPAVRLRNQPPGKYLFMYTGQLKADSASDCAYRFSDGTNSSIEDGYLEGGSTESNFTPYTDGSIDITSAISDSTFNLQYKRISSGTCRVYGTTTYPGVIKVYRFPSSAEIAVRPELLANSWSGYHDSTCFWTRTSTSYGDLSTDASCALVEKQNRNFGTVTGSNTGPQITFTPKKAQMYYVCAITTVDTDTAGQNASLRLTDGTTVVAYAGGNISNSATAPFTLCGLYNATSTASVTLKLQGASSGSSTLEMLKTGGANVAAVEWSIFALDQSTPAPVLVGSVTSTSTGSIRQVSASFGGTTNFTTNCTGTPCTIWTGGSGLSSVSRSTTGTYKLNFTSGVFASAPECMFTCGNTGGTAGRLVDPFPNGPTQTATSYDFTVANVAETLIDSACTCICNGPKGSL